MEGLLNFAQEFLRDQAARARAQEIDRAREQRLATVRSWFEGFARGDIELEALMVGVAGALREMTLVRGVPVALWGFKNDDERAFPERLAIAAARVPEVDLKGVLRHLLADSDQATDDERVNRLLAFADFVADLDGRGAEGDPRLGVGPSANFLTFAWHLVTYARESVFLFDSNKAIKSVAEASGDPQLQARDLEGRFRAFYAVSRRLAAAVQGAQPPLRPGWAVEHVLEYVLERTGAVAAVAASLGTEDAAQSGLWRPKSRAEVRLRPPSGRMPALGASPLPAVAPATPSTRPTVTIQRPRSTKTFEVPTISESPSTSPAAAPSSASPSAPTASTPAPPPPPPPSSPPERTSSDAKPKTDRFFNVSKGKTIMAEAAPSAPSPPPDEPVQAPEPREMVTPRGLPRIAARGATPPETRPPAGPTPTISAPSPTISAPSPTISAPSPTISAPSPTISAPSPTISAPSPTISAPSPTISAPSPTISAPAPTISAAAPLPPPPATPVSATTSTPPVASPRPLPDRTTKQISQDLMQQAVGELIGEIATAEAEPDEKVETAEAEEETWRSDRLARDLSLDATFLADVLDALATRGRVLISGPAATGKSYLARRLALHVAARDERIVHIRCHAALGYDELVEARLPDGQIVPGIVRELFERARRDREDRFALILDDVDRGDMGRALGELLSALSERGSEVVLARSRTKLWVPKNLVVLATARSAPLDLVGRFPVVEAVPDEEVLRRFLQRTRPALAWAADLLREANVRILRDRGPQARLGHGLLMDPELDSARLEGIWRREVLPFVRSLGLASAGFEIAALRKG